MSEVTADLTPEECIPDVPDVSAALQKLQSEFGKKPKIDFFPPDFNVDVSKFFGFNFFSKILGKGPGGLDFDTCAVAIEGDIDGAIAGGPVYPDTMGGKLESIDQNLESLETDLGALADQVNELGDSSP